MPGPKTLRRCAWVNLENPLSIAYHDEEWGRPLHDDDRLFEMLTLEGAQAGLSWETILKKRQAYRKAFLGFDPRRVSRFSDEGIQRLMNEPALVRNALKLRSVPRNARGVLELQKEFGSLDRYLWGFRWESALRKGKGPRAVPTETPESRAMSRDLRRRGFSFVGPTICYAFMQAVGMVNDHARDCFLAGPHPLRDQRVKPGGKKGRRVVP